MRNVNATVLHVHRQNATNLFFKNKTSIYLIHHNSVFCANTKTITATSTTKQPYCWWFHWPCLQVEPKRNLSLSKSSTVPNPNAENRRFNNDSATKLRKIEAPLTPGRPLFSFSSSTIVGRNLPRKSFPSK